jgi:hypothetical protein
MKMGRTIKKKVFSSTKEVGGERFLKKPFIFKYKKKIFLLNLHSK